MAITMQQQQQQQQHQESKRSGGDDVSDMDMTNHNDVTETERLVASILLQLPTLIPQFHTITTINNNNNNKNRNHLTASLRNLLGWGVTRKRKRSASSLRLPPPQLPLLPVRLPPETSCSSDFQRCVLTPPPPPFMAMPPLMSTTMEVTEKAAALSKATSPNTPLDLSAVSEAGERMVRTYERRKVSVKKTKDELLQIELDSIKNNTVLKQSVKDVRRYYNQLKAENLALKARKKELSNERSEHQPLKSSINARLDRTETALQSAMIDTIPSSDNDKLHQRPLKIIFKLKPPLVKDVVSPPIKISGPHDPTPTVSASSMVSNNSDNVGLGADDTIMVKQLKYPMHIERRIACSEARMQRKMVIYNKRKLQAGVQLCRDKKSNGDVNFGNKSQLI